MKKAFAGAPGPSVRRGSPSPRAPLLLCGLIAACAFLPVPSRPGGTTSPVPDAQKRYPWLADLRWPSGTPRPSDKDELGIAEEIDRLLTGDFDVYPVAARHLILRGGVVLPYLGQAAERSPAPAARKERLAIVLRPVLRDLPMEQVLLALASPYAIVRAAAAAAVGERRLEPLGPRLIELLEDKDLRVRRAAIASLRMMTGEFLHYRPGDPPAARAASAAAWSDLWQRR